MGGGVDEGLGACEGSVTTRRRGAWYLGDVLKR